MIIDITRLSSTNEVKLQRSAIAPVGMVAAVSMKTIWNRNSAATGAVYTAGVRKNPCVPNRPNAFPPIVTTNSPDSVGSPPNVCSGPTPPICSPNPMAQKPTMPIA